MNGERDRLVVKGLGPYSETKMVGFLDAFIQELLAGDAKLPENERTTLNLHPAAENAPAVNLTFEQKNVLGNMTAFLDDIESLTWKHGPFNRVKVSRQEMAALLMKTETANVLRSIPDFNAEQIAVVILSPYDMISTKDDGTAFATPYGNA